MNIWGIFGTRRDPAKAPAARAADPTQLTRTQAAARVAQILRRGHLFTLVYAPRGDAGRVAVRLLFIAKPPQALGWIELPLNGSITMHLDDSSVAAQIGAEVTTAIEGAFRGVSVVPVPADARQATTRNGYVVRQAATGIWTIATRDGEVRGAGDTFEAAFAIASSAPVAAIALGQGAGPEQGTGAVRVTMDTAYAARWIAHALREAGNSAWVEGSTIELGSGSASGRRVEITCDGARFAPDCPEPERTLIGAALGAVHLVDHLE